MVTRARISKRLAWRCSVLLIALLAGCTGELLPTASSSRSPADAQSWAYQLQNIDPAELAALDVDLIVMDYADNDGVPFTHEEIDQIRAGDTMVLSYLSIGEAETYRPYWKSSWSGGNCLAPLTADAPDWLDPENPEWCGNYPVQFWRSEWQSIVITYLDAIIAAGFDGVYLDKVDVFYYWLGEEDLGQSLENVDAPQQMVGLIKLIAEHGQEETPGFIIMPQNAASIIEYLGEEQRAEYLDLIDGIGVEDTFFYPPGGTETGENAPYNPQEYILELLVQYQEAGIPIFAIDYVTEPDKIERFFSEAGDQSLVPYAANRTLDRLGTIPRPAW